MKKLTLILSALFVLLVSSCTNELENTMQEGKLSFSSINASMGDLPTARIHLEGGGKVVWDQFDRIGIFSDTQPAPEEYMCISIDEEKATFDGNMVSGNSFLAYFPYIDSSIDDNVMTYTMPDFSFHKEKIDLKDCPIVAKSNTNEFKFKHTCGIIKFSIKGTKKVEQLALTGNNNEIIAGTGTIDLNKETPLFSIPADAEDAKLEKTVIPSDLQLSSESPTEFYFVLPVMDFTKGLNLRIQYSDENGTGQITKTTSKTIKVSRSVIKSFSTIDLDDLIESELEEEKREEERIYNALMAFYNATGGENWTNKTNWGSDKPISEWYGIVSNFGEPTEIVLYQNNLVGYIPQEIGNLNKLTRLMLHGNKLSDTIPSSIGNLKELTYLNLQFNQLTGSIPNSICNLTKLTELELANNRLTGVIPKDIGNMVALESFGIQNASVGADGGSVNANDSLPYYNQISGEIPLSLTTLPNLRVFNAGENNLSGNIPDAIWSMPSLTNLTLEGNLLTGSISPAIANAKKLTQLWLGNNHLMGAIPEEICELTNLKELKIGNVNKGVTKRFPIYQYNKFEGSIPNNIGKLTNLVGLSLSTCGLSGSIPNSLYTMSNLYGLSFDNSGGDWDESFGGNIDSNLSAQIRQNYNHISGTISSAIGNMTNLDFFHAMNNDIEGSIPKEFAKLSQLRSLLLIGNKMSGVVPEEIISSPMWSSSRWNPAVWILRQQEGYGFTGFIEGAGDYTSTDYSSDGVVKTLQTAEAGKGIDIVLMGDGYTDRLIADGTYDKVMNTAMEKFFSEEPYKSYRNLFNVYSVKAVSKNEVYYTDGTETTFSGYFGDGTLVGGNDSIVFKYAQKAISADRMDEALIVVMMNSLRYAGTCYMYYPESNNDYGNGVSISYFPVGVSDIELAQVLHHEAGGHGFAKLGDEYAYEEYGVVPTDYVTEIQTQKSSWGWWKNVDFTNNLNSICWSKFINDSRYANEGLGAYEGGLTYWTGVWRPTENSIMRNNTGGFNAPSREAIYYRIHKLAYGEEWQYDYDNFVTYDVINRTSTAARSVTNFKQMEPLHEPIVIKRSWKKAKNNSSIMK